ncbi:MAG: alpha/beta hydrolase [Aquificaceae bacterium]|nr:alpha/beta hydrolase [Aquificaceae bacterium]MDW8097198.1 alpha/beta hydrolase [Aquificaceae bacterium]
MDLPFHGRSSLSYRGLWWLARELSLRALPGSLLLGWSMGASLALMMAYLHPKRFKGLVLVGASACFGCFWPEKNLRGFLLRLEKEGEGFVKRFRSLAYPKPFEDRLELKGAKLLLKDYMRLDLRPVVPYIKQRVALLHGSKDPVVPFSSALALYNLLKDAKLIVFPGGHFPEDESLVLEVLQSL